MLLVKWHVQRCFCLCWLALVRRWGRNTLQIKGYRYAVDGWQLVGALQHDNRGRPAFFHRTMNKWHEAEVWPVELVTGPIPARCGVASSVTA